MIDPGLRERLQEALAAMERGPGAPCNQAQADGFPCPELGHDCIECDYGREALMAWMSEHEPGGQTTGGDW